MNLWAELRRRRVYRLAALYILGAWLILQVADIFFPAWGIPETAMRYLIIAATACFPIAVVFGWFFDITPQGIRRTPAADAAERADFSLHRSDFLILSALLVVSAIVLVGSYEKIVESLETPPVAEAVLEKPANSVAVLPFANLDGNQDTAYFSDGVSEEILFRLASVESLKVLGRMSSFPFANSDLGIRRISDILGVRYMLVGSVRRQDDRIRLTASLLDDSGFELWSGTFNGQLDEIFDLQAQIASEVATQISNELVAPVRLSDGTTTSNFDAYQQYLIGQQFFNTRAPNWEFDAEAAYRHSIELDPSYALPYAGLAIALTFRGRREDDMSLLEEAADAATSAMELAPSAAESFMARGFVLSMRADGRRDLESAAVDYERAIEINPGLAIVYNWLAILYNDLGRGDDWAAARERGLAVDPLNPILIVNASDRFVAKGDLEGAVAYISRLFELPQPPGLAYRVIAYDYRIFGRLVEAVEWQRKAIRAYCQTRCVDDMLPMPDMYFAMNMPDDAEYWIKHARRMFGEQPWFAGLDADWAYHRGDIDGALRIIDGVRNANPYSILGSNMVAASYLHAERYADLVDVFEAAAGIGDTGLTDALATIRADEMIAQIAAYVSVAQAYRALGRDEAHAAIIARMREVSDAALAGGAFTNLPDFIEARVWIHLATDNLVDAAAEFRNAVDAGWCRLNWVQHHPLWRDALASPQFADGVLRVRARLAGMRRTLEASPGTAEFREEFEHLLQKQLVNEEPS